MHMVLTWLRDRAKRRAEKAGGLFKGLFVRYQRQVSIPSGFGPFAHVVRQKSSKVRCTSFSFLPAAQTNGPNHAHEF
ncbi:MAG: hypothetical protein ACFBZ9_04250, partial [Sphingomonadales bacterium]